MTPPTTCPSADTLLGFAAGDLAADGAIEVEAHIDGCGACRTALSSLVRGAAPEGRFGRYVITTVLGAGGMGLVYRAFDPQLERAVAIKVVRPGGDDDAQRTRLVREAQSLARLSHPHVCHVYDVGRDDDDVWVAMELIDGVDLKQWAAGRAPAEVRAALVEAARGLAAAHAVGLVHRDVKPQNVLVTRSGRAVVTDFGLARVADAAATTRSGAGVVSGTPAYLAPEQLTAAEVDARVDQFAWAVMAWELLAGERPFPVEPAARLAAIRGGVTVPRGVPPRFGAALVRALAAAPRDRFASMDEVLAEIAAPAVAPRIARIGIAIAVVAAVGAGAMWAATRAKTTTDAVAVIVTDAETTTVADPVAATVTDAETDAVAEAVAVAVAETVTEAVAVAVVETETVTKTVAVAALDARAAVTEVRGPPPDGAARVAADPVDAAIPIDGTAAARFDRARAERMLADCRFPVDPARPDAALEQWGAVIDWGRVTRKARLLGSGGDGEQPMSMYEVEGARRTYRLDGDGIAKLGSLDVGIGDLVVVCPFALPSVAEVDRRQLPPGWRTPSPPIYAFAPSAVVPRIVEFASLAPLHVPERVMRGDKLPLDRTLIVWAKPRRQDGLRWDMGGWTLDASDLRGAEHVRVGQSVWLIVDRPRFEDAGGGRRAVVRGVAAVRRLLE